MPKDTTSFDSAGNRTANLQITSPIPSPFSHLTPEVAMTPYFGTASVQGQTLTECVCQLQVTEPESSTEESDRSSTHQRSRPQPHSKSPKAPATWAPGFPGFPFPPGPPPMPGFRPVSTTSPHCCLTVHTESSPCLSR